MIPILGALILQAAYGAVDLLVVGRFAPPPLSAVSTGSQGVKPRHLCCDTGLAMGVTVLDRPLSREKNPEQIGPSSAGAGGCIHTASVCLFQRWFFFCSVSISVLMQLLLKQSL